jgi:hypothetical protein
MSDHRPHGKSLILDEGAARLWFAASRDLSALAKVFPKTRANLRLVQPAPDDAVAKALVPVEPVPVLFRYDAACRAVAECVRVDEAKDIRDKAEAIRVYARQVKNPQLEADAWAIRKRAERQIGKLSLALDTAQGARTDKLLLTDGKKSKPKLSPTLALLRPRQTALSSSPPKYRIVNGKCSKPDAESRSPPDIRKPMPSSGLR